MATSVQLKTTPDIDESWKAALADQFAAPYFLQLKSFILSQKKSNQVYPPSDKIFSAFNHTPLNKVKVVIIGQDPYHGPGQAHGLCFSVPSGVPAPPSLVNMFKELHADIGMERPVGGNLEQWAAQGVLLLNATLTVNQGQAGSHQKQGWEQFTDAVIAAVNQTCENVVFLLWGRFAQNKAAKVDGQKHLVLKAAHPSPLSAHNGFFGCKHFSQTNEYLASKGKKPIDWALVE